jgi:hypothetical protein
VNGRDPWPPPGHWRDPENGKQWRATKAELSEANRLLAKHRDIARRRHGSRHGREPDGATSAERTER